MGDMVVPHFFCIHVTMIETSSFSISKNKKIRNQWLRIFYCDAVAG